MKNDINIEIGKKLQNARKSCGFTQEQVGEKIGCAPRYIGQIETNQTKSSIPIIIKLCSLYGITLDYLYSDYLDLDSIPYDLSSIVGYFKLNDEHKAIIENTIVFLNRLEAKK